MIRLAAWLRDGGPALLLGAPASTGLSFADPFRVAWNCLALEGFDRNVARRSPGSTADRPEQFPEEVEGGNDAGRVVREFE